MPTEWRKPICKECEGKERRAKRDENPFRQKAKATLYTRDYLIEVTGYSREYLSRIANGKEPLGQVFIDRCCFTLKEPQEQLFTIQQGVEDERS